MYSKIAISAILAALSLAPQVSAHSVVLSAVGDASSTEGTALGMDPTVPRDGTRRNPFQQDATIFRGQRSVAEASGCGATLRGGANNINSMMAAMAATGEIAQVSPGGTLTMTLHQVNADGAGPYTCMIDATGTGASFTQLTVTQDVPGRNGRDRDGETTDFPLVMQIPANMQCTGTAGAMTGICMVRCQNGARAGPFGGCTPVQMADPNANVPVQQPVQPQQPVLPAPVSSVIAAPVVSTVIAAPPAVVTTIIAAPVVSTVVAAPVVSTVVAAPVASSVVPPIVARRQRRWQYKAL